MRKILITGSNGLLGQSLINRFLKLIDFEIIATSKGNNRNLNNTKGYKYIDLDLSNTEELSNLLDAEKPNIIINSGAMTNVDLCEKEPKLCYSINTKPLEVISKFCKKSKSYLIHTSTDFVFDGKKDGEYLETDKENPINVYGNSKYLSEQIILKENINYAIFRTSQIYGFIPNFKKNNLITWIKNNLENNQSINIINDQYRMPTYSEDLVEACILAIEKFKKGIFNIVGKDYLSIIDIAYKIAEHFKLNKKLINSISTKELNLPAERPLKTKMFLEKSKNILTYTPKSINYFLENYDK